MFVQFGSVVVSLLTGASAEYSEVFHCASGTSVCAVCTYVARSPNA